MKKAISAGGVIFRKVGNKVQVLLLKYPDFDGYSFPKGHVDDGESIEDAAMREVKEETGMDGFKIIKKLGVVTRESIEDDGSKVTKDIHLFLMDGQSTVHIQEPEEECEWHNISEVSALISFKEELEFFRTIIKELIEK